MHTVTLSCSSLEELESCIEKSITVDFYPTVSICFFSSHFDPHELTRIFDRFKIDLMACSSAGEFTNHKITSNEIAVVMMDVDKAFYRLYMADVNETNANQLGEETAKFGKLHFRDPAFISLLDMNTCGDVFIEGVQKVASNAKIFGGLASVENTSTPVYLITNNKISNNAVVSLILDTSKIEVKGEAISGWEAIGSLQTITKCDGNKIMEINGEPALSFYNKVVGTYHNSDEKQDNLMLASFQYPLQIIKEGEPILRAPLRSFVEENSILVGGKVSEGDQFKFSYAPGIKVVEETVSKFKEFAVKNFDIDAVFLFSCKAREAAFGPIIEDEVNNLQQLWKKPMVGFFCFGEIGQNSKEKTYLFNETCSIVTLKEK